MNWQNLFLSADGRIGQKDFWLAYAILFAAGFVAGMLPLVGMLISLALIYPSVCIFAKRLHDFGRTGWLAAVPYPLWLVVTLVMFMAILRVVVDDAWLTPERVADPADVAKLLAGMGAMVLVAVVGLALYVAYLLWVGLSKADPGPNRYGARQPSMFDTHIAAVAAPRPSALPESAAEGNIFGIVSFVLGLISIVTALIPLAGMFAAPTAVLGLIFGVLGRKKPAHRGATLAGLVCSGLALLLAVGWLVLFGTMFAMGLSEAP